MTGTVGTDLFGLFYDRLTSFTFFKLDYSFNSDVEIFFSDLTVTGLAGLAFTELTPSIAFTEKPNAGFTDYSPTLTNNKDLATTALFGTGTSPAFITFGRDSLILNYEKTTFPY